MSRRELLAVAAITVFALVIAACGGGQSPGGSAIEPVGDPEQPEITVGVIPIVDVAPVYLGQASSEFLDQGLNVTTEVMQGGAAAIPALQSGELDIAYGAWPSFLLANQQGIELVAVADGVAATEGFTQFLALPDSGLEGNPAGMAGTTVAVNTLGNVGELALRFALDSAGLQWEDVTAVEVPFPDMGAALDGRSVDVIWAVEPGVTDATLNLNAITVVDSYVGDMDAFPVAGYFVTKEFAEQNPNTVAAFRRAIQNAADQANTSPQSLVDVVATYTSLPPEVLADIVYPAYQDVLDVSDLQRVYDLMQQYGMIEPGLDVESLVISFG
jgi:NitT/TauT family transport system substrate-binding protein